MDNSAKKNGNTNGDESKEMDILPKGRKARNFSIVLGVLFLVFIGLAYMIVFHGLPNEEAICKFQPKSTVREMNDIDWSKPLRTPICKVVPLDQISQNLQIAVIISEDARFFEHSGIDMIEFKKAFWENFQKRRYARGASTITMQLARNAYLTKKKSLLRKVREIILTNRIEKVLTKKCILELYLNLVEWGENIYGAEAASWYYFKKHASELNMAESTLLAGILPNPKRYNPFRRMKTARRFQERILKLMRQAHLLDEDEFEHLLTEPIYLRGGFVSAGDSNLPEPVEIDSTDVFLER